MTPRLHTVTHFPCPKGVTVSKEVCTWGCILLIPLLSPDVPSLLDGHPLALLVDLVLLLRLRVVLVLDLERADLETAVVLLLLLHAHPVVVVLQWNQYILVDNQIEFESEPVEIPKLSYVYAFAQLINSPMRAKGQLYKKTNIS